MTIDNFNAVAPWFDNLSDQGDFFFVQVMQRNKEKNNVGIHVITLGFDLEQFKQQLAIAKLDNIDIHKDNPTILYYSNE